MASCMKTPRSEPTPKTKSTSRLALITKNTTQDLGSESDHQIPHFSVEYALPSPPPSKTPSKNSITKPKNFLPLHDHLVLSPSPSPVRKSRTRLSDRLDMVDDLTDPRRRCKAKSSSNGGFSSCFSPRNLRRSRRRNDAEDKDYVPVDDVVKPRKRRVSAKSKKEKITSLNSLPHSRGNNKGENALDQIGHRIWELIIWKDVAKSSLWFGFGCLCFLSSCFTKGLNISLFSVISQLGLLFLAASFMSNSLHQRENIPRIQELSLKEDDILRAIKVLLPAINLVISKTRQLFSGEPSMTLKVALFLLVGAEYGHLLTIWRLSALGFFTSFTAPKLYASYSAQIHSKAEQFMSKVLEAWQACYHKKVVAGSAATVFWNLSSIRTRVIAAFISLVILRYYRQLSETKLEEEPSPVEEDVQPQEQAAKEEPEEEPQKALVVVDAKSDQK